MIIHYKNNTFRISIAPDTVKIERVQIQGHSIVSLSVRVLATKTAIRTGMVRRVDLALVADISLLDYANDYLVGLGGVA